MILLLKSINKLYNKAEKMPGFRKTSFTKFDKVDIIILFLIGSLIPFGGLIFIALLFVAGFIANLSKYNELLGKEGKFKTLFNKIFNI